MKQVLLVLMLFISFSSHALVGDETCTKWAIYGQTKSFPEHSSDKSFLNRWKCSTPNGSGHNRRYHCTRKLRKCVEWTASPSAHMADKIAEQVSKKIAEQIVATNDSMNKNYVEQTFTLIDTYTQQMTKFLDDVISSLRTVNGKEK